jgi:hypothetical protein
MFVRQNQQQFRNSNADVQIFYGSDSTTDFTRSWNKPPGVSHVYMLAIGGGAPGDGATGGGSGAVSRWYGAAQNVPDTLIIRVCGPNNGAGSGGVSTTISYRNGAGTTSLVNAISATTFSGAGGTGANYFSASGFYAGVGGQTGNTGGQSGSATTFLTSGSSGSLNSNYGYVTTSAGVFMLQPIIGGVGGSGSLRGGLGCGGGFNFGPGGQGLVLIASW